MVVELWNANMRLDAICASPKGRRFANAAALRYRMDLCLRYGHVTLGIELKVWRDKKGDPLSEGLSQLDSYLARLGEDFGWLVIFDRRNNALPLESRLSTQSTTTNQGRSVTVVRA